MIAFGAARRTFTDPCAVRNLLDALRDRPTMLGFERQRLKNQQIERSLNEVGRFAHKPRLSTIVDAQGVIWLGPRTGVSRFGASLCNSGLRGPAFLAGIAKFFAM